MNKREHFLRYVSIGAVFLLVAVLYMVKLVNVQITGQDYYRAGSALSYRVRREPVYATRGEVFDRNGIPLITNEYSGTVLFDAGSFPTDKTEGLELILSTIKKGEDAGATFHRPTPPLKWVGDKWDYVGYLASGKGLRLMRHLSDMNLGENPEPETAANALMVRFGIAEKEKDGTVTLKYDHDTAMLLFDVRLDMLLSDFSQANPYEILSDVTTELVISLREGSVRGLIMKTEAKRVYEFPGIASHILGRTGKIPANSVDYYTELGYPLDAIVGISGAEAAFEKYLHGEDGVRVIVEDTMGNVVDSYIEKEPVPGKDVYLTLDIELQKVAEASLADNIKYIVANALASGEALSGEDADAGALTVINAKTGEVLALASYPTYDLTTFSENYGELAEDPLTPMLNRALMGIYTPGSTFKVGVAVAALNEGIISPWTTIHTTGTYTYYEDTGFAPRCWINLAWGGSHGTINVTEAIQVSCNCFFYEMGRLLTIEKMNAYCTALGLGQPTGIELTESKGILAGPDYRAEAGLGAWGPGDTVQAAIGQIENSFTPLQISVYTAAILNGGERTGAHILKEVREYGAADAVYVAEPQVLSKIDIDPAVITTVKGAMKNVTEDTGSAARLFENYPMQIGGKTGTAQVSKTQSDNAVFTAFAPFDSPEIVATCVIEKGAGGTDAGFAVRDVFSYYFDIDFADGFDAFQATLHPEDVTDTDDGTETDTTTDENTDGDE